MKKQAQLKLVDRTKLQAYLEDEIPVKIICKKLGVSKQTIYREIHRNSIYKNHDIPYRVKCVNDPRKCIHKNPGCRCTRECKYFIQQQCKKVIRFPFICNKCSNKIGCILPKRYYYADKAQERYEKELRDSRKGIKISKEDFKQINNIISPLIKDKGQSLNHILSTHTEINVSERTLRNWINNGYTDAKNIDLPRKVSFKPKKEYAHKITKPTSIIIGRSYLDFKKFCKENPSLIVSQFDTVEGKKTDIIKILTIHFPSIHFQFGILLSEFSAEEVNNKLLELRNKIGIDLWKKIFPIMLSDNGIEFNKFYELEYDDNGEHLSNVFYCDPYRSSQKGACEKNHEFIRYIEPKHHSLDHLTQEKVDLIFSHINSVYRASLNGVRPIDLALIVLGEEFLNKINIKKIEPDDVNLTQSLTKKIKIK